MYLIVIKKSKKVEIHEKAGRMVFWLRGNQISYKKWIKKL